MIRVRHYGGAQWGIECPDFSNTVREESKITPGLTWTPERRAWCGYVDAVDAAATRIKARKIIIDTSALPDPNKPRGVIIAPMALTDLRDYQKVGVHFLVGQAAEGALLADEVGLGKTLTGIRAARAIRGKTVVICPNFLKGVWFTGIFGDKKLDPPTPVGWPLKPEEVMILKSTKPTPIPESVHVVIINYDILHAWIDTLIAWGPSTVIMDEGHMLMGDKARRTRAASRLARSVPNRIMLTATPMTSRPRDLWAPIDVVSEGRLGAPFKYFLAHCAAFQERVSAERVVWNTKGSSRLDELQRRLSFFMLRRTKDDVGMQLPPRTRQMVEVEVKRQFALSMAVALQNDESLRRALDMAADGKMDDVVRLVMSHASEGNKIVVGTWRKIIAESIADALRGLNVDAHVITGDVSDKRRKAILEAKPQVICATLDSMGMGLDLSFANIGVCAELHYVPSKLVQWEGRMHRFRQKMPTLFQYVVARGTADELVRDTVIRKLGTFAQGVGKSSDGLMNDLEGGKKSPSEILRGMYLRMQAKQKADPDADNED